MAAILAVYPLHVAAKNMSVRGIVVQCKYTDVIVYHFVYQCVFYLMLREVGTHTDADAEVGMGYSAIGSCTPGIDTKSAIGPGMAQNDTRTGHPAFKKQVVKLIELTFQIRDGRFHQNEVEADGISAVT